MITVDECESRIWNDALLLQEAINDGDFAGWLTSSLGPLDNDPVERNERVWDAIEECVRGRAEWMAKEMNKEYEPDAAHESRRMNRDNAIAINAGRY